MSNKVVIKVFSGNLVVFFLCSSFILTPITSADFGLHQGTTITKYFAANSISDVQFPMEEKEAEKLDREFQNAFIEYCPITSLLWTINLKPSQYFISIAFHPFCHYTSIPVYLAKKALLI